MEFGTRTAGEIMTPRVRTLSLEVGDRAIRVIQLARTTGHSRFPVLDADDTVVGTVHVKHAVALPVHERATTRVKHLMAKPIVVPDSLRLDPLLALLREDGFQLAVVLDEYGGHAGIVTLEDVVEEIVGDIADEHDRFGARARKRRDGSWLLSGLLRPDEVEDLTGVPLPESEDYDTVAGLVLQVLGRIPERGDIAEVPVADSSDVDEPRQQLVDPDRRAHGRAAHRPGRAARSRRARGGGPVVSAPVALTVALLLLLGNAFFVGAEFALVSARRTQIEPRAEAGSRDGQDHPARHGEHVAGHRRQPARHHRVLAGPGRGRRAGGGAPRRAGAARRERAGVVPAPDRVRDRAVDRRLPARGARRDDPQEPRAGRAGPGRAGAGPPDLGDRHRAPPGHRRDQRVRLGDPAPVRRAAHGRGQLDLHTRGGRGSGRGVPGQGPHRGGGVRPARGRPRASPRSP